MRLPTENDLRFPDPVESGLSMSEDIDQIATALHSALDLISNAPKTTKGHNYKYAPLEVVLDIIRKAYKANGLFLLQTPWTPGEDQMGVTTLITHTSGQWISSQFSIKIEVQRGMNLNQSCGTLLTYLRRYSAMSFNFLTAEAEDVDGISNEEKSSRDQKAKDDANKEVEAARTPKEVKNHTSLKDRLKEAAKKENGEMNDLYNSLTDEKKLSLSKKDKKEMMDIYFETHGEEFVPESDNADQG